MPGPALVAVLVLFAIVLNNPVGYVGGGGDDWPYVQAARCIAAHGWCEPATHWAARWPLVLPMGLSFHLIGDSWAAASFVPFVWTLVAVVAFVRLAERWCSPQGAMLAGVMWVTTAVFAKDTLQPNIETAEVALLLLTANAAATTWHRRSPLIAALAGVVFAMAVAARMTSLAWLPIIAIAMVLVPSAARRLTGWGAGGATLAFGLEALFHAHIAGDALLPLHLSMAHTRIATSELPPDIDLTQSPLFNPQFIGGWHPAMDIQLHWTVNGVVNLLASPLIAPVLVTAVVFLWLARHRLHWRSPEVVLFAAGVLYTGALIYGLAIDPKPRMFLPVAAIAALLAGRLGTMLWDRGERVPVALLVLFSVAVGTVETQKRLDFAEAGPTAMAWARGRSDIAIDDMTRRFLTFTPGIAAVPVATGADTRVIVLGTGCTADAAYAHGWSVVRAVAFGPIGGQYRLCEISRADRAAPRPR